MTNITLTWYVRRSGTQPACVAQFAEYRDAMNKAQALNAEAGARDWFVSDKPGLAA